MAFAHMDRGRAGMGGTVRAWYQVRKSDEQIGRPPAAVFE